VGITEGNIVGSYGNGVSMAVCSARGAFWGVLGGGGGGGGWGGLPSCGGGGGFGGLFFFGGGGGAGGSRTLDFPHALHRGAGNHAGNGIVGAYTNAPGSMASVY